MKTRLSVSAVVSSIILAACGGGGGSETKSTIASAPVTAQQAVEPTELLTAQPILLPDLKVKYDRLCGRNVHVQYAIPVDVNKDNKLDLVFNLWCLRPESERGKPYDGIVPNGLVILVQDSQGKFQDKTFEVFGDDLPSIGGIGIDSAVSDFNNDGVKDIVFAVNREDGRLPDKDMTNHKASSVALMSDGNGKYKIVNVTNPEYGYRVVLRENSKGTNDIVMLPFETPSSFTYNNSWNKLSGYDWVSNVSTTFFKSVSSGLGSTTAIVPSRHPRTGIELWVNNNSWSKISEYRFPEPTLVYVKSWTGATGLGPMFTLEGVDYLGPMINFTCEIKRTTNGAKEALALFMADEIIGGYKGGVIDEQDRSQFKSVNKFLLFDTNNGNGLTKIDLPIKNDVKSGGIYKLSCNDINNDGLTDLVYQQPQGGPPSGGEVIYPAIMINDGTGSYNRVDTKWFPRPGNGTSYIYEDFNNDGIRDLLYFPLTGYTGHDTDHGVLAHGHLIQANSVRYHLHIGKRKLKSSDMM